MAILGKAIRRRTGGLKKRNRAWPEGRGERRYHPVPQGGRQKESLGDGGAGKVSLKMKRNIRGGTFDHCSWLRIVKGAREIGSGRSDCTAGKTLNWTRINLEPSEGHQRKKRHETNSYWRRKRIQQSNRGSGERRRQHSAKRARERLVRPDSPTGPYCYLKDRRNEKRFGQKRRESSVKL